MNKKAMYIVLGVVIIAIAIGAVIASGHKSSPSSTTSNTSSSQVDTSKAVATNSVSIINYMFSPMIIKVKAGSTVTWTNQDSVHHSVVADSPSSDAPNSQLFGKSETYSFTFKKAGTYPIHCSAHPYMTAAVVVTSS